MTNPANEREYTIKQLNECCSAWSDVTDRNDVPAQVKRDYASVVEKRLRGCGGRIWGTNFSFDYDAKLAKPCNSKKTKDSK